MIALIYHTEGTETMDINVLAVATWIPDINTFSRSIVDHVDINMISIRQ